MSVLTLCLVMFACRPPSLQSPQYLGVQAVPAAQHCRPQQPASPSSEPSVPLCRCGFTLNCAVIVNPKSHFTRLTVADTASQADMLVIKKRLLLFCS